MMRIIYIDVGKWWEIIVCVGIKKIYVEKCWEIIAKVDIGKRWEKIVYVDVEIFYIKK